MLPDSVRGTRCSILQDKTGTLTQNKMEVVSVAVEDEVFDAQEFRDTLSGAAQEVASNLSQVIAVGGLCNSAVFGGQSVDGSPRSVLGNQTGKWPTSDFKTE